MKTLGLIGGTSWVSTVDYYRYINKGINAQLGGLEFAQCIIYSFNFGEMKRYADAGDTESAARRMEEAALHLKNSGADCILLCANTMHMHADRVNAAAGLPVIHIATATAEVIAKKGLHTVALLGTRPTMELTFYKDKLSSYGINTMIPSEDDRNFIHETIFGELGKGIFLQATKERYVRIINDLVNNGAQGAILGCTEIPLLVTQQDVSVPVFDTTKIHADAAVAFALQ